MSQSLYRSDFKIFNSKIRCVLVHEHVLLRQALRRLLEYEPDITVVGEAGNAAECLRQIGEFRPDVVVADAGTFADPDAQRWIKNRFSATKFVFLSATDQSNGPGNRVESTVSGCDVRETSAEELVQMVRASCRKDRTSAQEAPSEISSQSNLQGKDQAVVPAGRALTPREREVLKLLAEGKTVRTAAIVLGLSSKTVDSHKFNLMRKLGLHNKAELVMWAVQRNLVKIPANM